MSTSCWVSIRSAAKCTSALRPSAPGISPLPKIPCTTSLDMRRGVLLASARLPDPVSPSVSLASTSVVPSSMIQRGSRARLGTTIMNKKGKRRRGDGNRKFVSKETDVLSASEVR